MPDRFTYTDEFFNELGTLPAAGGKLYFYIGPNTTTPKNTYSDIGLTTPNSNPVVLSAEGRLPNIFLATGSYSVKFTTSIDVEIWTKTIEGKVSPSAQVPIPTGADAGKILNIDGTGNYQLSTTIRGTSVAYAFANTAGGQIFTVLDEGAASAIDGQSYIGFSYATTPGGSVTRTGYVGDFNTGNTDIYLGSDIGNVRLTSATGTVISNPSFSIGSNTITSTGEGTLVMSGTAPLINFYNTAGAADTKYWRMQADTTSFYLVTRNDANSSGMLAMQVLRSGTSVTGHVYNTSSGTFSFTGGGIQVNSATGTTNIGDVNITGSYKVNGTSILLPFAAGNFVGSSGSVTASSNITSVVRNSTGDYTVTMTTAAANANYAVIACAKQAGTNGITVCVKNGTTPTTTVFTLTAYSTANALIDPATVYFTVIPL